MSRPDRGHERRPGRAARHAAGDLRAAGDAVRRRLHRHLQPARRRPSAGRRTASPCSSSATASGSLVPVRAGRRRSATRGHRTAGEDRPHRPSRPTATSASLRGTVAEVVYLGTSTSYTVRPRPGPSRGLPAERLDSRGRRRARRHASGCRGSRSTRTRSESDVPGPMTLDPALLRGMTQRRSAPRRAAPRRAVGRRARPRRLRRQGQGKPQAAPARRRQEVLGRQDEERPLTSPTGRSTWTRRQPELKKFTAGDRHQGQLQRGHPGERPVLRQDRSRSSRPASRSATTSWSSPTASSSTSSSSSASSRRSTTRKLPNFAANAGASTRPRLRPGQRLQHPVDVGHHRHRLQPEEDRTRDHQLEDLWTRSTRARSA